jgi:GTP:adenosylcobinamide-phosphate guanylyltransferase
MDAIVTAGGIPQPQDPLYPLTQGGYKTLLDIHGKPIVQWVLDALSGSQGIENVFVVGLPIFTDLACTKPLQLIADQGGMLENIRAGVQAVLQQKPGTQQLLAVAGDIPAVTPEMVDWMVERVRESDHDLYYNVVERKVMEARFPGSKRSYTRLKDMEVCGGDMNAIRASIATDDKTLYQRLIAARKSSMRQASLLGFDTLLFLLLHQLSLADAARVASKRLEIDGRAIVCPYPEIGMDVDKPHQLEMLRHDLARQKVG